MPANGSRPYTPPGNKLPGNGKPVEGKLYKELGGGIVLVTAVGSKYVYAVNSETKKGRHMVKFSNLLPYTPPAPPVDPVVAAAASQAIVAATTARPTMEALNAEFLGNGESEGTGEQA